MGSPVSAVAIASNGDVMGVMEFKVMVRHILVELL